MFNRTHSCIANCILQLLFIRSNVNSKFSLISQVKSEGKSPRDKSLSNSLNHSATGKTAEIFFRRFFRKKKNWNFTSCCFWSLSIAFFSREIKASDFAWCIFSNSWRSSEISFWVCTFSSILIFAISTSLKCSSFYIKEEERVKYVCLQIKKKTIPPNTIENFTLKFLLGKDKLIIINYHDRIIGAHAICISNIALMCLSGIPKQILH